jgi:hypothetical protein
MSPPSRRSSKKHALVARDAGLRRIATATRVLVAGSIAATGLFTAMAAWAQPGRTKSGVTAGPRRAAASGSSAYGNVGGTYGTAPGDANLSPPSTLPVPGYQYSSPAVVSGAS